MSNTNVYEMLFKGEISLEEFAILTAQEPQDVVARLKEIIDQHECDFVPSIALKDVAKRLYSDFVKVNATHPDDDNSKFETEVKLADTFRKTVVTLDSLLESKRAAAEVLVELKPKQKSQDDLSKIVPYLCPKCKQKLLDLLELEMRE